MLSLSCKCIASQGFEIMIFAWGVVVVLGFYIPPTAKVIRRQDLGLKSHPKDFSGGSDICALQPRKFEDLKI